MRLAVGPGVSSMRCLLIMILMLVACQSVVWECTPSCNNPCTELNGRVELECATCPSNYQCHPGAAGFPSTGLAAGPDGEVLPLPTGDSAPGAIILPEGPASVHIISSATAPTASTGSGSPHPRCGRLIPSQATDKDSLCVHLVHGASTVMGDLRLLNTSSTGQRHTPPPQTVRAGTDGWWAISDGVFWAAVPSGYKDGAQIQSYTVAMAYRGACVAPSCGPGDFYDLTVRVSLRGVPSARPPSSTAEHHVVVTVSRSSDHLPSLQHDEVGWTECILQATATLSAGGSAAAAGRRGSGGSAAFHSSAESGLTSVAEAVRALHPESKNPPEWCTGERAAAAQDQEHTIGGTHSIDLDKTPSACEQYAETNATNKVHIKYFLEQQRAETAMQDAIETSLCDGSPDEATFQRRLEELLKPVRMAVRLHVHMAFIAKSTCSRNTAIDRQRAMEQRQLLQLPSYADGYFLLKHAPGERLAAHAKWTESAVKSLGWGDDASRLVSEGRDTWLHLLSPYSHTPNQTIGGHARWSTPVEQKVTSVAPDPLPDSPALTSTPLLSRSPPAFTPTGDERRPGVPPRPARSRRGVVPAPNLAPRALQHVGVVARVERDEPPAAGWRAVLCAAALVARRSPCLPVHAPFTPVHTVAFTCTGAQPLSSRVGLTAAWRAQLEAVQHRHRHNNAFLVYSTAYEAPCKRLQLLSDVRADAGAAPGVRSAEWRESVVQSQAAQESFLINELEGIRSAGACDLANVSAVDLIAAFGNDTQISLAMGKALLTQGVIKVKGGRCPCESVAPEVVTSTTRAIGALAADARVLKGQWMSKWGAWMLTLATAYHKLVPICQPADPVFARFGPDVWDCDDQPLPTEPDGKLVYDLIPMNAARGFCYGPKCAEAARAIDAYRAYLHEFSGFRVTVVHSMVATQCPFLGDSGARFVRLLVSLNERLPKVLHQLWEAREGLAAACVAPSRSNERQAKANWEQAKQLRADELKRRYERQQALEQEERENVERARSG